ncbi:DUF4982 domain-containing protein [Sphingobacterium sp. DK4209]|uniref:DUF4982 domain-containing protein n=1 Tax=Sphingobacterium zhuxiongii TaxID=2662364 RepID=A0A5Q0QAX3_9SPHI|nr:MULTISPECIES: alginate lyase family protein [unclassified Sphingobacterium]MVZ64735.1 DUF4982 domain-containing protein [Sphingobacterium sp. DK4209]QGA27065.1 DUF4982 domain-containing protein [Sphingobacterium sp. dk4302]
MLRKIYHTIFLLLGLSFIGSLQAQTSQRLINDWEFLRSDLGGIWEGIRPVPNGAPESVPIWSKVQLPHTYNASDAVNPHENYYQGPAWYRTQLYLENPYADGRMLLHFEGSGQKTKVYVFDQLVQEHVGGYDEWYADITDAVAKFKASPDAKRFKGKVPVLIRTDNSRDLEMIPSDLSDFTLFGGLYRYVNLVYTPKLSVQHVFSDIALQPNLKGATVALKGRLFNPAKLTEATLQTKIYDPRGKQILIKQQTISIAADGNFSLASFQVAKPMLWSPDQPNLYRVELAAIAGKDTAVLKQQIGFRSFEFVASGPFKLNGERLLLRGTHRHEDHAAVGQAMTEAQIWDEMRLMKDMGVNFIRLGHYQQSRIVLEACDQLGILVWEEIPWCRGGLGGPVYKEQARRMLTNMIEQHYNHPSIIIWGLGNENDWPGDFNEFDQQKIRAFMSELHQLSHKLDDSRKTAIRRCDFCKDIVDVYSPSIWAGWYRGVYTDYKTASKTEFDRVNHFLHVEWGGDSHARRHSETPDEGLSEVMRSTSADERAGDASLFGGPARVSKDGDWSESYIVNLIDWHLKEQETMPWLTGTAYWPFKDFTTPVRPENPVPYMNQKGVVERNLNKKESFYVFQSYWTEEPMVRIYGHSWPTRWGEEGQERMVKVYSNVEEVELFHNGISLGKKKRNSQDFPAAGLRWMVKFKKGENNFKAIAKKGKLQIEDQITQHYQTEKWGKSASISLAAIETKGDTVLLEAKFLDAKGIPVLDSREYLEFASAGDGFLIIDQGTSDGSSRLQAYNGRALIRFVRTGKNGVVSVKGDQIGSTVLPIEGNTVNVKDQVIERLKTQVIQDAEKALKAPIKTISSITSERSLGTKNDFYSEGDYWWPNPANPDGPYIRKDGMSNPENFVAHRELLMGFGDIVSDLVSGWLLTKDHRYAKQAIAHAKAWFMDKNTHMNPSMNYAQAIKGVASGRGIGLIDGIHLIEVARSMEHLKTAGELNATEQQAINEWFASYLQWMNTHPYGLEEKATKNNHASCWLLQAAAFARYTENQAILDSCVHRFQEVILPNQMADNGSFPLELARTKPYGYSLFNLDIFAGITRILQKHSPNIARLTADGKNLEKGIDFMYPYIVDKAKWSYPQDVMYWDNWPIAHSFLLFGAQDYQREDLLAAWMKLPLNYSELEVRRNSPMRHPLLWIL